MPYSIKTIPRLEGAGGIAGRPPGRGASGPPPGPPPRCAAPAPVPLPASPGGAIRLRPVLSPRSNKTGILFKTSIEQNRCCCSVGAGAVGAALRVPARASPCAPSPVAAAPRAGSLPRPVVWSRPAPPGGSLLPFGPPCGYAPCGGCRRRCRRLRSWSLRSRSTSAIA